MSPAALELLSAAYKHYLATYQKFFSYQYANGNDLVNAINGAQQLYDDGYVENLSNSVTADTVSLIPYEPISFELTYSGIEYMRSNRKL